MSAKTVHLEEHLKDEQSQENKLGVVCHYTRNFTFWTQNTALLHNANYNSATTTRVDVTAITHTLSRCASGCVVECRICKREVAGSHLSLCYFAPRSTQRSIPLGSVNEYQLRLGRQRQVWLIPIADERVGVQVKLRTRAKPERFCGGDSLWRGTVSSVCIFTFIFTSLSFSLCWVIKWNLLAPCIRPLVYMQGGQRV